MTSWVRQALQMALDLDTVVDTYYKGYGDATPQGQIGNDVAGIGTPFEEWPEDVKKTYRYDPEGAEGVCLTRPVIRAAPTASDSRRVWPTLKRYDVSYAELAAGYWREIGVDVEIDVFRCWRKPERSPQIRMPTESVGGEGAFRYALPGPLDMEFLWRENEPRRFCKTPTMTRWLTPCWPLPLLTSRNRLAKEANMYLIENQFRVWGP